MRRRLVLLLLLASFTAMAKDPPPFDPAGDPAQQAATFLKGSKLEALGGAKRVAISQFRVEFMVENSGKSVFVGPHGMPYYMTNDDKHIGLGAALGGFSTVQPQNIEPRIAESLQATVLRATMSVKFADVKKSGGMFRLGSSVDTQEALAWVPEQTQFLFVTPDSGKARVTLETTTKGEKAVQAAAKYDAIANPEAYQSALTQYGSALESALVALVRPALTGAAAN